MLQFRQNYSRRSSPPASIPDMKKLLALGVAFALGSASAGDLVGTFMHTVGEGVLGGEYLDYDDPAMSQCDEVARYAGRAYGKEVGRVYGFSLDITAAEFKRRMDGKGLKQIDFYFGKTRLTPTSAWKTQPYLLRNYAADHRLNGKFMVAYLDLPLNPTACVISI